MPLLSASDLKGMRQAVGDSLDVQATVQRNHLVQGAGGGQIDNWRTVAAYGCRVEEPKPANETVAAGKVQAAIVYPVVLPYNADVTAKDRLLIGGAVYDVTAFDPSPTDNVDQTAYCVLLT